MISSDDVQDMATIPNRNVVYIIIAFTVPQAFKRIGWFLKNNTMKRVY